MTAPRLLRHFAPVLLLALVIATPILAGINTWTSEGPYGGAIRSIALDPTEEGVIYVAAEQGGLFKGFLGGDVWVPVDGGLSLNLNPQVVRIHPLTPQVIYGLASDNLFQSTDGGERWDEVSEDLQGYSYDRAFVLDPSDPDRLFLGTNNDMKLSKP